MSAPTAFITIAQVEADLSALTTARLVVTEQHLVDACSAVVSLIRGASADWPEASEIPHEWGSLARQWLAAKLAGDYPEYFRFDGAKRIEEVERRIARRARVDPPENLTHARSVAGDPWDYACDGEGVLP